MKLGGSASKIIGLVMIGLVRFGMVVEGGFVRYVKRATACLDRVQKSLYKSTLLASLWIGVLFTIALLIIALIRCGVLW